MGVGKWGEESGGGEVGRREWGWGSVEKRVGVGKCGGFRLAVAMHACALECR